MEHPEQYLGRLRPIYIFRGLSDEQILEAARAFEVERHPPGEVIFQEREEGQDFYIINRGAVKVLRGPEGREPKLVATLVPGDFFGERALLYGRPRSATIETATEVELLRLSKEDFDPLLRQFPQIRPNLLLSTASLEIYRRHPFSWLGKDEVVYLITRKHWWLLVPGLFWPVAAGLLLAAGAVWVGLALEALWVAWVGAGLEGLVALWLLWVYVDWSNDFYILTNQRVVHLEKIVAIYDSRQEAPLSSIMSVDVETDDVIQRALDMGDIVVRTYSGPIALTHVPKPRVVAAAIEQNWFRTQTREREANIDQMRRVLRDRMQHGPRPVRLPGKPPARKPPPKPRPMVEQVARFFSLRVRYEEGPNVIYRKHWYKLIRRIWRPALALVVLATALALVAAGVVTFVPLTAALLAGLVLFVPLAGWALYEFIDWHNDIYMITEDQIMAISKKPLGTETKKTAPLGNVLSLKYERPGLIGILLNYGTVMAQVANTEFRFEGVFDPMSVQNDVYRRMEAQKNRKAAAEETRKREELADLLSVYHGLQDELEERPAERGQAAEQK
jgi:hypothetical protein